MRLLANENIPRALVDALRNEGHDVSWILEDNRGAKDAAILTRATEESRTLLTFDKDFGELAFRELSQASSGVILLRLRRDDLEAIVQTVVGAVSSRDDWVGHLSVIEDDRIRMTPMPDAS